MADIKDLIIAKQDQLIEHYKLFPDYHNGFVTEEWESMVCSLESELSSLKAQIASDTDMMDKSSIIHERRKKSDTEAGKDEPVKNTYELRDELIRYEIYKAVMNPYLDGKTHQIIVDEYLKSRLTTHDLTEIDRASEDYYNRDKLFERKVKK